MAEHDAVTYEGWFKYSFTRVADVAHDPEHPSPYLMLEPSDLAGYMHRFCSQPPDLSKHFTDEQIAGGLDFIFSIESGYWSEIRRCADRELQVRCMASVANLYTRCLDRLCCKHGAEPDVDFTNHLSIDGVVYMIWDMDQIQYLVDPIGELPHLVEPGLKVLETVLHTCRTSTCLHSALHGLGHLHGELTPRIQTIIDGFLRARTPPRYLVEYARDAWNGHVL